MAIKGQLTLDELNIIEVNADPSVGGQGVFAPVGSIALLDDDVDTAGLWLKATTADTGWYRVANETLLRHKSYAPYVTTMATTLNGTDTLTVADDFLQFYTGSQTGF